MIGFIDRLRTAWQFTRHQKWVHPSAWSRADAERLEGFLKSDTGRKFKEVLLNTVLMQNASAITDKNQLQYSCGFAMGQASLVKVIEVMANAESISDQDTDPDLETIQ